MNIKIGQMFSHLAHLLQQFIFTSSLVDSSAIFQKEVSSDRQCILSALCGYRRECV